MCDLDLSYSSVWRETSVRARKLHQCSCCGGPIAPGETYVDHFSVTDKTPTYEKQCAACTRTAEDFQKEHGQRSNPSYMPQLLRECVEQEGDKSAMGVKWSQELTAMRTRRQDPGNED